jgi:group I intron endonuclease
MAMSQGIYKITNLINGDCYVGQSINIERRWKEHINKANSKKKFLLHKAFNKYGTENFKFEILELVPNKNDLTIKEQCYYDLYKPYYCLVEPEENPSSFIKKIIYKIDIETLEILDTYESIAQASAIHNIDNGDISSVCNRKQVSSGGFYWCFKSDYSKAWKPLKNSQKVVVYQLDKNDYSIIKKHDSVQEAHRFIKRSDTSLHTALNEKILCANYYWCREKDYTKSWKPKQFSITKEVV